VNNLGEKYDSAYIKMIVGLLEAREQKNEKRTRSVSKKEREMPVDSLG
jgi:hypothetical protein